MEQDRKSQRMRHESARRRTLKVAEKTLLAPNYLSIRFDCDDFGDFVSASADDHVKLFIPGQRSESGKPPMRDYTPRAFDAARESFTIDFALHPEPGPATAWAIASQPGDTIEIGGPRGSVVVSDGFSAYWLIGDEAAIPSIMRRLAEWPDARIRVMIEVATSQEQVQLPLGANHDVRWVHRQAGDGLDDLPLVDAFRNWFKPAVDDFVWIAAEASAAKALREAVLETGHPAQQMKASGYWTRGMADTTAKFD